MHRHWEGSWERRNEVTGCGLKREKKKEKRGGGRKKAGKKKVERRKSGTGRSQTICQNPANDL